MHEESTETPTAPDQAEELDLDGELPEDQVFDRDYVTKLRSEAAARRTALRDHEAKYAGLSAFEDTTEADRQVWNQLAALMASDTNAAAQAMQQIASALLGEPESQEDATVNQTDPTPDADEALTPAKVQELIAAALKSDQEERTKSDAEKGRMAEFDQQVEAAGFKRASPEYYSVVSAVAGGQDIEAAIKATQDWRQGIIDSFVQERQGDKGVRPPSGAAAGQQAVEAPKTLDEATAALRQMIQDQGSL